MNGLFALVNATLQNCDAECERRPGSDFAPEEKFDKVSSCQRLPLFTVASIDPTREQLGVFIKWLRLLF